MRKLLALLAVLTVGAAQAEMSTSAEFRLRGQADSDNTGNADNGASTNWVKHRLKLGMDFNAGEKISGHATLIHNSTWGQNEDAFTAGTGDSALGVRDGTNDSENLLMVNEAYGTWALNESSSLRFGRGNFEIADGTVIGANEWEDMPYAFEGVMYTHDMEFGRVSGFGVKFADWRDSSYVNDAQAHLYGLSLDVKAVPDMIKMLNFHILQSHNDTINTGANNVAGSDSMRFGLTVKGETAGVDFRATYASDSGENDFEKITGNTTANTDIKGTMMDVEVGYTLENVMNLRLFVVYHSDSGDDVTTTDDEEYDSFYYNMHENAGRMDILKWGNLTYMQLGATMMPMDDTTVGLNFIQFSQTDKASTTNFGSGGQGLSGATMDATKDALGTEIDLWATKKYEGGFSITARYGQFTPGDDFKTAVAATSREDAITHLFLEAGMTF